MSALTGNTAASTYGGLLKTSDAAAVTSSLKTIEDGLGNSSALQLSTTGVKSTGTLEVTGAVTLTTALPVGGGGTGSSTASTARTALGLAIGTDVQAYDAELAALAGVTSAADKVPYFTGSGAASVASFTAAGRALVDDADAAAQRTTLGLGTMATQAAGAVAITGGTVTGITDLAVADGGTGSSTAAGARTNLGLGSGDTPTFTGTSEGGYTGSATAVHKIGVPDTTIGIHMKQVGVAAYSFLEFTNSSNTLKFQVDENGATTCSTLTETSARKYKSDIRPLTGNLALAKKLLPCAYVRDGKNEIGFIADEVHAVVPEVVVLDEHGEPASVNYSRLTAILAGAVQELDERLARLEARL